MDDNIQICEVGDIFYKIKKDGSLKQITITQVIKTSVRTLCV